MNLPEKITFTITQEDVVAANAERRDRAKRGFLPALACHCPAHQSLRRLYPEIPKILAGHCECQFIFPIENNWCETFYYRTPSVLAERMHEWDHGLAEFTPGEFTITFDYANKGFRDL
jgi:hypothetical protein